ncbi:hypothetical protein FALBO_998 [Fusarium albosuccineum]|uniref:Heterokaryon incompatibility domain-containing protein n=1 Tax=Fusarium albosuccineum TaxID=1237068 RepID=A0A8H4LMG6_9HYPO|nr:hypothetical protein FALBO_998 [Fusarium albosuccineum]
MADFWDDEIESTAGRFPCTICEATHQLHPRLCHDCQPWADLTHLIFCKWSDYFRFRVNQFFFTGINEQRRNLSASRIVGKEELQYHELDYYLARKECMVCSLIADSVQSFSQRKGQQDLKLAVWRPFLFRDDTKAYEKQVVMRPGYTERLTQVCLLPGSLCSGENDPEPLVLKLFLEYAQYGTELQRVSRWQPGPIPLSKLQAWLENCHEAHGKECNEPIIPMKAPNGFRLIDTTSNSIVECSEQVDYVALSYCWAAAASNPEQDIQLQLDNVTELSKQNGLQISKLPPVISDAMQLCRDVGQRYLWVDRLCIIQDDPKSKFSQITAMERIYHMAEFTIVALSAKGLPGVSSRPRDTGLASLDAPWEGTLDTVTGASTPVAEWAIQRSKWDTRGWTFQERKLSRRLVFIDDRWAYFSCFQGVRWERDAGDLDYTLPVETGVHVPLSFSSYANFVTAYTMRQLSFRSDILNAFAGVANILASQMDTSLLFGLPEKYFLQALIWRSDTCSGDRDPALPIPSWSWASWDGTVEYVRRAAFGLPNLSSYSCALHNFRPTSPAYLGSLVKFFYSDPDTTKGVRPIKEYLSWFDIEHLEYEDFDTVTEMILDSDIPELSTWQSCIHSPLSARLHESISDESRRLAGTIPGCLVFTTTCAYLALDEVKHDEGNSEPPVACFNITTDGGDFAGQTMLMSRAQAKRLTDLGGNYFVIVIGAGYSEIPLGKSVWQKCAPGDPYGLYVMVTERREGVLYRLAIGVVDLIAWTNVKPAWETVVLA